MLPLAAMQNSWSYIRMRLDLLQEKADAKRKEALYMGWKWMEYMKF
jgi:hypothetical protein